jgi:hypothetical protein
MVFTLLDGRPLRSAEDRGRARIFGMELDMLFTPGVSVSHKKQRKSKTVACRDVSRKAAFRQIVPQCDRHSGRVSGAARSPDEGD